MSMSTPMEPNLGSAGDGGIPAADPGLGAPDPAAGFGIGGEEPDPPEEVDPAEEPAQPSAGSAGRSADPPFRTPDPGEVSRFG